MPNWIAYQTYDLCLLIDLVYPKRSTQSFRGQLPGGRGIFIIERAVSKKRSARWTENSGHDSRLAHGDRNHRAAFTLGAFEQTKHCQAIDHIAGLHRDLQDACRRRCHALVDLIEIRRNAAEIMMRADNPAPI